MKNFSIKTILFPTDFSPAAENALNFAILLAQKSEARLVLLNVIKKPTITSADGATSEFGFVPAEVLQQSRQVLKELAEKITAEHRVVTEYYALQGFLYENVIRSVHLYTADIIVMGTHGDDEHGMYYGSNTYRIVKHSPVPVLTIHEGTKPNSVRKIIFPVNEDDLTVQKAEEVIYLAKMYNAEVLALGVMADVGKTWIIEKQLIQLSDLLGKKKIKYSRKIVHGPNYSEEILKMCEDDKAVLVAVACRHDASGTTVFHDKHTEKLVNQTLVPVLSVPAAA